MEQKRNNTSGMCEAEQRIALATIIAYQIGKDLDPQQIAQLITFINVINAQLALLASAKQQASLSDANNTAQNRALTTDSELESDVVIADDIDIAPIL